MSIRIMKPLVGLAVYICIFTNFVPTIKTIIDGEI